MRVKYLFLIYHSYKDVSIDELLLFSEKHSNYHILFIYLSHLNPIDAVVFLEDHRFLYSKSSSFLYLRLILFSKIPVENPWAMLERYVDCYCNDNMFHCLCVKFSDDADTKESELSWLKDTTISMDGPTWLLYSSVLSENHKWEDLEALLICCIPNEYRYHIAGCLAESDQKQYFSSIEKTYDELIASGWDRQWLYFNRGIIYYRLGQVEAAKKYYRKEYDRYKQDIALCYYLDLCYETKEIREDYYLHQLELLITAQAQCLAAAFYLKLENYPKARKYYLRSLLIDEDLFPSIHGYWTVCRKIPSKLINYVQADVVCMLKNEQQTKMVALHTPNIMKGLEPNNFANCIHYSCENPTVAPLMFCKINDSIVYEGESYIITEILNVDDVLARHAFSVIADSPDTMKFSSSSTEELLNTITPILKASTDDLSEHIGEYNALALRFPLSVFARQLGKEMLATCEFLIFGNQEHIRNNLATLEQQANETIFILSYDSIVFLVHADLDHHASKNLNLCCATQVKQQLLSDIDAEFVCLKAEDSPGSITYVDGGVAFLESTAAIRRDRYNFLVRLKVFVDSIKQGDSYDFSCDDAALQEIFLNQKMYCESGTLGLAQNLDNTVIVTDDQFLYAIASTTGIPNIGLTSLLANADANWEEFLVGSKQIAKLNFLNYLPLELYQNMVDSLVECKDEIKDGSQRIIEYLQSGTESEPSVQHRNIIIDLFRDVFQADLEYLNPNGVLRKLAIQFYEANNPGYIQSCMAKVWEETWSNLNQGQVDDM